MAHAVNDTSTQDTQMDVQSATSRRKTAVELVAEDRARLQLALETAKLFSWEIRPEAGSFTSSVDVEAILGFSLPATTGGIQDVIHPDDRDAVTQHFEHTHREHAKFEAEFRILCPDEDTAVWVQAQGVWVTDDQASGARLVGVTQNINDRKHRELNVSFLLRLGDAIRHLADPVTIQREATRLLGEHLGASRVTYGEILPDGVVRVGPGYIDGVQELPSLLNVADFDPNVLVELTSRRTVVCADMLNEPDMTDEQRSHLDAVSVRAHVDVPLVKDGRLAGVLSVHQSHPHQWSPHEVTIIEETAERTWAATERARTEERLRKSEERYRTLFETIDEGFCVLEVLLDDAGNPEDYRFLEVNPAFERHTGLRDAAGKTARELVPDHEKLWFETFGKVAQSGKPALFVEQSSALSSRWFDVHAFRVGDPDDRHVAVLFVDITESQKAEIALRESAERLWRVIEIDTVGVIFFRPNGEITFANEAFLRMSGYTHEDVENGRVRWDVMTPSEWMPASKRALDEFLAHGRTTPYEKEYVRKNGSRWWALFAAARIDDDEGVEFIIDTSKSKRAELERERLAAIVENSRDAVMGIDMDGVITDWNPAATKLFGYTAKEVVGHDIEMLVPPDQLHVRSMLLERLSVHEVTEPAETSWRRKDGTFVEVEIRPSPVLNSAQQVIGAAVIAHDATERKRLERAQEDFLAMASHDLRSPLTVVRGRAQLMQRREKYDADGVNTILEQVRRIERLVADLQELVKLESGGFELQRSRTDLDEVVQQAVKRAPAQAGRHMIRVAPLDEPVTGSWDQDRLGQVLDNLLSNAIKYSPDGGEIVVSAETTDKEARLSVTDQGPGISAETLPHLFERFYRADHSGSASGLGLGLYITRMLVEAHGGQIWAESTVGEGSTFIVTLPIDS